jgi:hypothetical protein
MGTKNSDNLTWQGEVVQEGEDLLLTLPEDLLKQLDWKTGDVLQWVKLDDNSWCLKKND